MLVLVGFPGSGKSTVANSIVQQSATLANSIVNPSAASESSEKKAPLHLSNWYRVNQDEMGSRVQCESSKYKRRLRQKIPDCEKKVVSEGFFLTFFRS
jgi:adenylate kinase family enzyme